MKSGLGRPKEADKYNSIPDYLNNYLFKIKDVLFEFREKESETLKEYNKSKARASLQQQKLDRAYEGLEHFRK